MVTNQPANEQTCRVHSTQAESTFTSLDAVWCRFTNVRFTHALTQSKSSPICILHIHILTSIHALSILLLLLLSALHRLKIKSSPNRTDFFSIPCHSMPHGLFDCCKKKTNTKWRARSLHKIEKRSEKTVFLLLFVIVAAVASKSSSKRKIKRNKWRV